MAGMRLPKQSCGLVCGIRVSTPIAGNRRCFRVGRRVPARMYRGSRRNQDPWQGSSQRQGRQDRWEIWADTPPAAPPAKLPALVLEERVMTTQYAVQGQKQQMAIVSQHRAQKMLSEHAASKKKGDAPYVAMKVLAKARVEQLQAKRLHDQNCRVPIRSRP